jgi:hypothetical protein
MGKQVEFKVVGLTFVPGYPENVLALVADHELAQARETGFVNDGGASVLRVLLRRNPENEHDENAIEVHAPTLGRGRTMIGHVPRDLAAKLAPSLDRGDEWTARVMHVLVDPEHPDRPGVEVALERLRLAAA